MRNKDKKNGKKSMIKFATNNPQFNPFHYTDAIAKQLTG